MTTLLSESDISHFQSRASELLTGLNTALLGQEELTKLVLIGVLSGGHVLLEGLPGLGKTELIKALAALSGLDHKRIQFTPDLLPADITGTQVFEESDDHGRQLTFRPGPLFSQLVLADEINRASPKTQSALLQAMAEKQVSAFDQTYDLPQPFFVLATQNPIEQDGTYPLPEAQLDRFALKLSVTGISTDTLTDLLRTRPHGIATPLTAVTNTEGLQELMQAVAQIALPEAVLSYIARLVNATRPELADSPELIQHHVRWGASPRAAIALGRSACAAALLAGRPSVGFTDVQQLAGAVLGHRIICSYEAGLSNITSTSIVEHLLSEVPEVC